MIKRRVGCRRWIVSEKVVTLSLLRHRDNGNIFIVFIAVGSPGLAARCVAGTYSAVLLLSSASRAHLPDFRKLGGRCCSAFDPAVSASSST